MSPDMSPDMSREKLTLVAVTYQRQWQDGFGARGWKLDCSIDDPSVIAATAETGTRIQTSVLVHDILDHHLCGVAIGGHRNEAKALYQLAVRTGSDPAPDFAQMVDEDLMHGRVNGEPLQDFLPGWLADAVPRGAACAAECIAHLRGRFGAGPLRQALIMRFFELGAAYAPTAAEAFARTGLRYERRDAYGRGLQRALQDADAYMLHADLEAAQGAFVLRPDHCVLELATPRRLRFAGSYPCRSAC